MSTLLANRQTRRRGIAFVILLAVSLLLMAFSSTPPLLEIQRGLSFAFKPIQGAIDSVAGGIASIAGAILIIIQPVEPSIGREYIGRVFAICVMGGLGSFPGMLAAAVLLGVVESITSTFFGPSWSPAVAFGFLLLTLAVRPSGIFGRA